MHIRHHNRTRTHFPITTYCMENKIVYFSCPREWIYIYLSFPRLTIVFLLFYQHLVSTSNPSIYHLRILSRVRIYDYLWGHRGHKFLYAGPGAIRLTGGTPEHFGRYRLELSWVRLRQVIKVSKQYQYSRQRHWQRGKSKLGKWE